MGHAALGSLALIASSGGWPSLQLPGAAAQPTQALQPLGPKPDAPRLSCPGIPSSHDLAIIPAQFGDPLLQGIFSEPVGWVRTSEYLNLC